MTAMTATGLITAGYRDAQKIARGATLDASQLAEGMDRLNDLINLWQTQGLKLFLQLEVAVTLVAAQQTYSFMPGGSVAMARPLQILSVSYWDSDSNSRPLIPISRDDWSDLTNRTSSGSVTQYFVEKLYDRINLNIWNSPDATAATGTLKAVVRQQAGNVVLSGDTVTFPTEWAIALRWGIADEVSFGMPEAVQQRCQSRAQAYRQALEDFDVEDVETTFQPDARAFGFGSSRFR